MDEVQVRKAVLALQKYQSTRAKEKRKLIQENPLISLIIGLKKIPNKSFKPHRILIPHSLYPPEETELCLFSRTDKKTTKQILEEKKVQAVKKMIPFDKLKTDYKSFEAKRNLSTYYDVYLADRRIYHLLPRHLGKSFFVKKRFPFPVNMQKTDLKREIAMARDSTYLHLGLGSCIAVPIARIGYSVDHIVANILKGMMGVVSKIPRGWRNIQVVHLKTVDSIALPIYNSLPPEPKLLAPIEEGPRQKQVKLDDSTSSPNIPLTTGEVTEGMDHCESESPSDGARMDGSEREEGGGWEEVRTVTATPTTTKRRRVKATSVPRLARKKVRGSTVINSRYEKMTRRKSRGRKSF